MNIYQSAERKRRIDTIEITLREVMRKKRLLDEDKFVVEICNKFDVSERAAKEYIKIAKARIPDWMTYKWTEKGEHEPEVIK
jgi:hypothetical protein